MMKKGNETTHNLVMFPRSLCVDIILPQHPPTPTKGINEAELLNFEDLTQLMLTLAVSVVTSSNKGLNSVVFSLIDPFPNKPLFLRVCSVSLLKTLREKEKLLVASNFSFSHSVCYPSQKLSAIFIKSEIVVCKFFQIGRV